MSRCTIKNDTNVGMWIMHRVHWKGVGIAVAATGVVATGGIAAAGLAAGAGAGGALAGGGALIMAEEGLIMGTTAATFLGLTATGWTIAGAVSGVGFSTAALVMNLAPEYAVEIQRKLKTMKEGESLEIDTDKSIMDIVENASAEQLAKATDASVEQATKIKDSIKSFKSSAYYIAPGGVYTFTAISKSIWRIYGLNKNLEEGDSSVWTAFWYGTTTEYKVSECFDTMSMRQSPITITK